MPDGALVARSAGQSFGKPIVMAEDPNEHQADRTALRRENVSSTDFPELHSDSRFHLLQGNFGDACRKEMHRFGDASLRSEPQPRDPPMIEKNCYMFFSAVELTHQKRPLIHI